MRISIIGVLALLLAACGGNEVREGPSMVTKSSYIEAKSAYSVKQFDKAFPLALEAALAGDVEGQYLVGYMYYYGQGTPRNEEQALRWIKKAAENGNRRAVQALATFATGKKKDK